MISKIRLGRPAKSNPVFNNIHSTQLSNSVSVGGLYEVYEMYKINDLNMLEWDGRAG